MEEIPKGWRILAIIVGAVLGGFLGAVVGILLATAYWSSGYPEIGSSFYAGYAAALKFIIFVCLTGVAGAILGGLVTFKKT